MLAASGGESPMRRGRATRNLTGHQCLQDILTCTASKPQRTVGLRVGRASEIGAGYKCLVSKSAQEAQQQGQQQHTRMRAVKQVK